MSIIIESTSLNPKAKVSSITYTGTKHTQKHRHRHSRPSNGRTLSQATLASPNTSPLPYFTDTWNAY